MSIYKKVNDKVEKLADKSIIDHNQLSNRDQYGAHSISAIRKLPEKLTNLKEKDKELQELIKENQDNITTNTDKIIEVESKTKEIDIIEKAEEGTFTFTNYDGEEKTIQSGYKPDEDTLTLTQDRKMTLKEVHIGEGLKGKGTLSEPLDTKVKVDNTTIEVENDKYVVKALDFSEAEEPTEDEKETTVFQNPITAKDIDDYAKSVNGTLEEVNSNITALDVDIRALESNDKKQDSNIRELQTRVKGIGGYLNAYNFGTEIPTQEELNEYALQQITEITEKEQIFNQTKVKNLFDGNIWVLTNTPDSEPPVFEWSNVGTEYINIADNNGVQGIVTGSYENLEGFIDINGHITINGLSEKLNDLESQIPDSSDYVDLTSDQDISGNKNFTGKNTFNAETEFNEVAEHNANIQITNSVLKVLDNTLNEDGSQRDFVTTYSADDIVKETGENDTKQTYTYKFPDKSGLFALISDTINSILQKSKFTAENGNDDVWVTSEIDSSVYMKHENGTTSAGVRASKGYGELFSVDTDEENISQATVSTSGGVVTLSSSHNRGTKKEVAVTTDGIIFSETPKAKTGEDQYENVALESALQNLVPAQSETEDGYYAQISNENGVVQITISQNGQEPIHSLTISKNSILVDGKEIGSDIKVDNKTITQGIDNKLQSVALIDTSDSKLITAQKLRKACTIRRYVYDN